MKKIHGKYVSYILQYVCLSVQNFSPTANLRLKNDFGSKYVSKEKELNRAIQFLDIYNNFTCTKAM